MTALPQATLTIVPSIVQTVTTAPRVVITKTAQKTIAHLPILMYHYISTPPPNADRYRIDLSVKPEELEAQLRYLSENNYHVIGLYDLYAHLANGAPLPTKPVILTFDDGYRDAYEYAFPLLIKYKMTATFFIITDFINSRNPAYLTWEMVKTMSDAGMNMESHSRTHPDMRNRGFDFLVWQILGPIEAITAYTGKRPHFFCYPSGQYDDAVIRVLRSVETWGAVTTRAGNQHSLEDAMTWTRVRIHGTTSLSGFVTLIK